VNAAAGRDRHARDGKDANGRNLPTRSQTVGVRDDLPTNRGLVYAHVGFDSLVPVPIVLTAKKATITGGLLTFRENPMVPFAA
jgi:hypothetical protein